MTEMNKLEIELHEEVPKKIFTSKTKEYIKQYNKNRYLAQKEKLKLSEDLVHKEELISYYCKCCKYDSKSSWNMKIHLLSKKHKLTEKDLP